VSLLCDLDFQAIKKPRREFPLSFYDCYLRVSSHPEDDESVLLGFV
jgi:hypothetical protein